MNVFLNKEYLKLKKINNRYFKFTDKSEKQTNITDNINKFNKQSLVKSNNIYNSNFFSVNKIGNFKDNYKNNNIMKKDSCLKLNPILISHKLDNTNKTNNNLKLYYLTNFKNSNPNLIRNKLDIKEVNEENKINDNLFKENDSIPTINKIQKLIEALQSKHSIDNDSINKKNKISFDNNNTKIIKNSENNSINKKSDKLPSLIKDMKFNFKYQKNEINEQNIFPVKDMVNRVNHIKIKLKNLNHESLLSNKSKEENTRNIKIKAKDLPPNPRKPKVSMNQIKNMIQENSMINNNGCYEKIVNIRLKSDNKGSKKIFNLSVYQNKSLAQMKNKKESVNFCLSNYNNYRNNLMVLKQTFHNFENERTRKEKFFNKNQTMFKNPLNEKKYKEENEEYESEEEDSKRFSKYFLPSSGFGLLQRHDN